jgi:predicted RNA-binding Zn-ribbon protein involved in translation (DUF1610 family)
MSKADKETQEAVAESLARRFCPDCGQQVLRLIEVTEPQGGEFKEIHTCDQCQNIVYIVRNK